jgi:hypothetical protein
MYSKSFIEGCSYCISKTIIAYDHQANTYAHSEAATAFYTLTFVRLVTSGC